MVDFSNIKQKILDITKDYPDFPKKGILFHDVLPIFNHPKLVQELCEKIAENYRGKVDAVAGLEARGFLLGPQVSINLGVPFVPIRKKGKLPGETIHATYKKEYGEDIIEIQKNVLPPHSRVLLVDDLLATGGTLKAAFDLLKTAQCDAGEAFVLVELTGLKGREVLNGATVKSLITYEF
ncbi:unnamed protein product [Bursaphelenchus okinawaensis]|uniref:Adenine phosphoribosyltransferase n=1 Tax=Bursaphelenchus okinawaensis TaxID=465554 RepID=A0A811JQX8_9BILA|nr:unnamed protein product [Bursaphelenchus okinawaensis]CAG9078581.1 unnamed protein product [Bursaphelenchus okinawaensis]